MLIRLLSFVCFQIPILAFSQVIANFNSPNTICSGVPVNFVNTSQNASNYYWSFCAASFNTTPIGFNLGNPGEDLNTPVFMDYTLNSDGNYYGFVSNYVNGHLVRLNYGNSLLNNPVAQDLGNLNSILPYAEGIQVKKSNGNCYVFVVSAGDAYGTNSQLVRINFGNTFGNNLPNATNLGNIGSLNFPHDLFITQDGNNFYGFTININDNSITRFNFGNDLANTPTGINLGSSGNLSYPCGFSFINSNGIWYAFITNRNSNTISRLDFGNSLVNTPSGINIGNPGNFLNKPRDISIFQSCSGVIGLVVNEEDEQTGSITKLNFNPDLISNPSAVSLGNIGDLKFPHSISKLFLNGNDIYSFITNVSNNTITRLRYAGCSNASISSSTLQTPPAVSYNQPGVYNINLLVDIGLPTETSFCKQIVVKKCDSCALKVNAGKDKSICYKDSIQLTATGAIFYSWKSSNALSDTTIANPVAKPLSTTNFIVTGYDSTKTCLDEDTVKISVLPVPNVSAGNDTTICGNGIAQLYVSGALNYQWLPTNNLSNPNIQNPVASPSSTTTYYVSGTDKNNCANTDSVLISVLPNPQFNITPKNTSVCLGDSVVLSAKGGNIYSWTPLLTIAAPNDSSTSVFPDAKTIYQVFIANTICKVNDTLSAIVDIKSLPVIKAAKSNDVDCITPQAQLTATGGTTYLWSPASNISNTNVSNPVVYPFQDTWYVVKGTGNNSCKAKDSVLVKSNIGSVSGNFYIPNAFTPNGDGLNDCFGVKYWGPADFFEMSIYNRWGQLIYHSSNIGECWDGTFKGMPQALGVYIYQISITSVCSHNKKVNKKGTVVLMR